MIRPTGFPRLQNPDCFEGGFRSLWDSRQLYREGNLPKTIEGHMLIVPMLRMLRAFYGTNLSAAVHLLRHAVVEILLMAEIRIRTKLGWVPDEWKEAPHA
jgi:hypothetical protein